MYEEQQRPDNGPQGAVVHGPLAGFTVGVTAARRAEELGALLQRRGAAVLHAPALRIVPLADDGELLAATKDLIGHAPDGGATGRKGGAARPRARNGRP